MTKIVDLLEFNGVQPNIRRSTEFPIHKIIADYGSSQRTLAICETAEESNIVLLALLEAQKSKAEWCLHESIIEDEEEYTYICKNSKCRSKFPFIGDTDHWNPKLLAAG